MAGPTAKPKTSIKNSILAWSNTMNCLPSSGRKIIFSRRLLEPCCDNWNELKGFGLKTSIFLLISAQMVLSACSTTDKGDPVVNKHTWVWCWNQCGKGDKLSAVSNSACVCSNGGVIPMQPQVVEPNEPSLYDRIVGLFKD